MGPSILENDILLERRVLGDVFAASMTPRHGPVAADIILIPGSCHGWWAWRFWQPALAAAGYAVHALSMPNHTDAPTLPEAEYVRLTPQNYADRVAAFAVTLPGRPVVVGGHSLGGWVAQLAAVQMRPAGLLPVASAAVDALTSPREPMNPALPWCPSRDEARRIWFADAEDAVVEWALDRLCGESPATRNAPRRLDRTALTCPILVVGAGRDASAVPDQRRLAAWLGAECVMFENAGHDLMLERAALPAVRRVISWLDRVVRRA